MWISYLPGNVHCAGERAKKVPHVHTVSCLIHEGRCLPGKTRRLVEHAWWHQEEARHVKSDINKHATVARKKTRRAGENLLNTCAPVWYCQSQVPDCASWGYRNNQLGVLPRPHMQIRGREGGWARTAVGQISSQLVVSYQMRVGCCLRLQLIPHCCIVHLVSKGQCLKGSKQKEERRAGSVRLKIAKFTQLKAN